MITEPEEKWMTATEAAFEAYHDEDGGKFICNIATVILLPVKAPSERISDGGIVIPNLTSSPDNLYTDREKPETKSNPLIDALFYGELIACGPYQLRNGEAKFELPAGYWPPPKGSLMVHNVMTPYKVVVGEKECQRITCDNLCWWYLPGDWPKKFRSQASNKNGKR